MEQNDECPKGHCAVCGLGFAEYVACEEVGCEWVPEVKRKRKPSPPSPRHKPEFQTIKREGDRQMATKIEPTPWIIIARTVYAANGKPVIDLGWYRGAPGVANPGEPDPVRDTIIAVNAGRISRTAARTALAKAQDSA